MATCSIVPLHEAGLSAILARRSALPSPLPPARLHPLPPSLCLYLLRPRRCDQRVQTRHRSRLEALRPCLSLRPCRRRLRHWCSRSSSPLAFALALPCPLRGLGVGCIVLQYRCEGVEPCQLSRGVPVRGRGEGKGWGRTGRHIDVRKRRREGSQVQTDAAQAGSRCRKVPAKGSSQNESF